MTISEYMQWYDAIKDRGGPPAYLDSMTFVICEFFHADIYDSIVSIFF